MVSKGQCANGTARKAGGVIDSAVTPGGCWTFFMAVAASHNDLAPGQPVDFEWEPAEQDGFRYCALRAWPMGSETVERRPRRASNDADQGSGGTTREL